MTDEIEASRRSATLGRGRPLWQPALLFAALAAAGAVRLLHDHRRAPEWAAYDRGAAASARGDLPGATADFRQAVRLNPRFAPAYDLLAACQLAGGDVDGALVALQRLEALGGDPAYASMRLAETYAAVNSSYGLRRAREAVLQAPRSPRAHMLLAEGLARAGEPRAALAQARAAQILEPDPQVAAAVEQAAGQTDDPRVLAATLHALPARMRYEARSAPADRASAEQAMRDALAAMRAGDNAPIEDDLLRAITAWPEDADAYSRLGDYYLVRREQEVAAVAYMRLLAIAPSYPHVYCRLAKEAQDGGNAPAAERDARLELQRNPNCWRALGILATIDRRAGRKEQARAEAERAYRAAPDNAAVVIAYAESFLPDRPERGAAILEAARKRLPSSWAVAFDLGYCYAREQADPGVAERAAAELRRAEAMNPGAGAVHRELCRIYLRTGDRARAVQEGALAVRAMPLDRESRLYDAQALRRAGQEKAASSVLAQMRRIEEGMQRRIVLLDEYGKKPADAAVAHELAQLDARLGRTQEALHVAEDAYAAHPGDPTLKADVATLLRAVEAHGDLP